MLTIKTVLKSGGEYSGDHVVRMRDMIAENVKCPYLFACYTDTHIPGHGMELRPLYNKWPGWWSKLEIFRSIENSFYIDLDMTIDGDITDIVTADTDFMALRNMNSRIEGIGSAMMKWRGDFKRLYLDFDKDPEFHMSDNARIGTPEWGDQGYIWKRLSGEVDFFQDAFPGRIKKFSENGGDVKVFYGRKRPWGRGLSSRQARA